jgi:hypothetical protein
LQSELLREHSTRHTATSDWILTVPLLLVEVVAVLALAKEASKSMMSRLVPASAAMIILGYPGEISSNNGTKVLFGVLSTLPFLYILYVLFVELGKSLDRQPEGVAATIWSPPPPLDRNMGRIPNLIPHPNPREEPNCKPDGITLHRSSGRLHNR